MERYWNIIFYSFYKFDYRFHLLFNRINPVIYLYKLPFAKRRFKKRGIIDPIKELNASFMQFDAGISTFRASGFMTILFILVCLGFFNLYSIGFQKYLKLQLYEGVIFVLLAVVTNYFFLYKRKKYIAYFNEFEMKPKKMKERWAWMSFFVALVVFIFYIGSFFL